MQSHTIQSLNLIAGWLSLWKWIKWRRLSVEWDIFIFDSFLLLITSFNCIALLCIIKSVSVSNVHAMQEKVHWSFSSGGSNLHSAQAIITSPLLLRCTPLAYHCTLYSKHGHLWITTPSAYVHAMRVIVLFISFSSVISGQWDLSKCRREIGQLCRASTLPCRHAAIYSTWPFSAFPLARSIIWIITED